MVALGCFGARHAKPRCVNRHFPPTYKARRFQAFGTHLGQRLAGFDGPGFSRWRNSSANNFA